jgi:hypothetical protein
LDKLNANQLPPHEAVNSTLKSENISAEDYQLCQTVWEDNDMKTMKEFLIWYNKSTNFSFSVLIHMKLLFRFTVYLIL